MSIRKSLEVPDNLSLQTDSILEGLCDGLLLNTLLPGDKAASENYTHVAD